MRPWTVSIPLALGATGFLACATLDYPPPPPPEAGVGIEVSYFYDELSPYGDWVQVPSYGRVWAPRGCGAEWRPYSVGHWAYTDDEGWLWVSDEEWGWATYHYGRWYTNAGRWYWVPGRDWAPAWVAWRSGGGYIGWAPLPPQAVFAAGLQIAADVLDSLLEPRYYCFVEERHFSDERIVARIVPTVRNLTILQGSRNMTNYAVVGNRIVNRGLAVEEVERRAGHAVPRVQITETSGGPHRAQVHGTQVQVFRPQIQARTPPAPVSRTAPEAKLDQKHAREKADLEKRHTQEIQSPPKGQSIEQVKTRHESEHQAMAQRHESERQQTAPRQENQKKPH